MKPLRYCCSIIVAVSVLVPSSSSFEISTIIASAAHKNNVLATIPPILPALPFVPFFPVTAADFLPRDTPASYLRRMQRQQTKTEEEDRGTDATTQRPPVLVCIGDSLTHGSVSANWVSSLSSRLGSSHTVLNAGKNSETAAAVRARLDEIVEVRPEAVALLVGTNDLIGSLEPSTAGSMYLFKLWWAGQKTVPSLEGYERELRAIVNELDARLEESGTRIAVLSPPPLGEGGPNGMAWERGKRMATVCSEICARASERVTHIPLYDIIRDEMVGALSSPPREFSYREAIPLTSVVVPWKILLLGQSFDEARKANGYGYTIDSIHFGEEFANTVEEVISSWMIALP